MLDIGHIEQDMRFAGAPLRCYSFDEVGSTNDEVKQLIEQGAPEGSAVVALRQIKGYGRQGKTWISPLGGLYFSLLLTPGAHGVKGDTLGSLSLVVALAVYDVVHAVSSDDSVAIKWPNDVVCAQGKLCGISLETNGGAVGIDGPAVCVGIGLNVFGSVGSAEQTRMPRAFVAALSDGAGAGSAAISHGVLAAHQQQMLIGLMRATIEAFDKRYHVWTEQGFAAYAGEFNGVSYLAGCSVRLESMTGAALGEGQVMRVDENGCLVLRDNNGHEQTFSSGEAHVLLCNQ